MFAMVDLAQADAAIVCFTEKATWSFWRPVTAVQLADTDGNPATTGDPAWMPLLITPPFPDYTSGHTCASGASMTMFRTFFHRDDIAFSAFSEASGTTRHFTSFSQALTEVINARVWGGIHFRSADIDGARIGAQVAGFVGPARLRADAAVTGVSGQLPVWAHSDSPVFRSRPEPASSAPLAHG